MLWARAKVLAQIVVYPNVDLALLNSRRKPMRLVITGLEYSGKTALTMKIVEMIRETTGKRSPYHDHYWPEITHPPDLTDEEEKYLLGLTPRLKEQTMRNNLEYHVRDTFYGPDHPDHLVIGAHIEDAVMGPAYFGYGGPGGPVPESGLIEDRSVVNAYLETDLLDRGPDTVLVHLKASPAVVARRMRDNPHRNSVLQESDISRLLEKFEEQVRGSRIRHKIEIDTSENTPDETMSELMEKMKPHLSDVDKQRFRLQ
jgi:hypothetical protein